MEQILIVDDDPDIQRLLDYNLRQAGFETFVAGTGRKAIEVASRQEPDLIILDLMLPDIDGLEVCRALRRQERFVRTPVLMLTARGEEIDRVLGFELGADDYVTKPFSPREIVLRVKSILRRGKKDDEAPFLKAGRVRIVPGRRQCFVDKRPITLTAKEFDLLLELIRARGNVLTRDFLLETVWGYHGEANSRTLDTHVRRLREKLGAEAFRVETVRSVGYRIAMEE